jgi:hypothetical protein
MAEQTVKSLTDEIRQLGGVVQEGWQKDAYKRQLAALRQDLRARAAAGEPLHEQYDKKHSLVAMLLQEREDDDVLANDTPRG